MARGHGTSVVLMESFKQATGFFKAAHCVYLVGRILGVSAFTYSYGPSKRVHVRSRDVFFLLVPLCASVFTLLNYLHGGPLLSKTFKLKSPLFEAMMDFMNINSSVASTMLILYQFFCRKKYWTLLVEIDSIDFEVSDSDIPSLGVAKQTLSLMKLRSLGAAINHRRVFYFTILLQVASTTSLIFITTTLFTCVVSDNLRASGSMNQNISAIYFILVCNGHFLWFFGQGETIFFAIFLRFYGLNDGFE